MQNPRCPNCNQQIQNPIGHNNPWACVAALKLKVFELEGKLAFLINAKAAYPIVDSPGDGETRIDQTKFDQQIADSLKGS